MRRDDESKYAPRDDWRDTSSNSYTEKYDYSDGFKRHVGVYKEYKIPKPLSWAICIVMIIGICLFAGVVSGNMGYAAVFFCMFMVTTVISALVLRIKRLFHKNK